MTSKATLPISCRPVPAVQTSVVRDVVAGVANDVLELDSGLALPMHEECVLDVSVGERRIVIARGFAEPE